MNTKSLAIFRYVLCALTVLLLGGCVGVDLDIAFEKDNDIYEQIVDQEEDMYPDVDPLALSDEIRQMIDEHIPERRPHEARVSLLQQLLFGDDFLDIQYKGEKTTTAIETFKAREGNCLSAVYLYIAMARYVGVDANFQSVDVRPNWDMRGGLLVLSEHINATGKFNAQRRYVVDFTPEIALQQLTANVITDQHARALYFNNLGVEALVAGDEEQALLYFKNSLFLGDGLSITWNNIGAAYNRLGQLDFAQYSYQMAFNSDNTNVTSINNLVKYYRNQGNDSLARDYERAVERFNSRNPYFHYTKGNAAYLDNDYERAIVSFKRAIRLKKEEPEFHFALARVYSTVGDDYRSAELNETANLLIAQNKEIYQPSDQKVRIIDGSSILRSTSSGIRVSVDGIRGADSNQ